MKQLAFILFFASPLIALNHRIIEHHHFNRILDFVLPQDLNNKTIIVLDIDNTIAQPERLLGSEEWVAHMINKYTDNSITDMRKKFQAVAPLYFEIMHSIDFTPIEQVTIDIIRELQNSGIIVIGLTARSFEIADRTIEQLNNIGIDLSLASLWHENLWHDCHLTYCHKNGIIFCNGNDKGKVLMHVFERLHYCPTKVIAIDDKERHLQALARAIEPCIEFIGIRYGYLDEKVRNFDTDAADEQLIKWIIWNWVFNGSQAKFFEVLMK